MRASCRTHQINFFNLNHNIMNIHLKSIFSAVLFSLLFYSKSFGLNLVLIAMLVIVLVSTLSKLRKVSWVYSFTYLLTAVLVFLNPTGFSIFVHFMAFLVFVGKSITHRSSLYISWIIGLINMLIASIANLMEGNNISEEKKEITPKLKTYIQGSFLAAALIGVFTLMYKNANPVFAELIAEIDFSFISLPWLLFTILGYFLFLNLLAPLQPKELIDFDIKQGNELVKPTEIKLIELKHKLSREHTLGSMVFLALNLLLVFFLITDTIYLFTPNEISNAEYSQAVHEGVYALMFSIVCAITLILYFFRGNLNFYKGNKRIKLLTYSWIVLNVILAIFTCVKNFAYVEALGLTYKRIGVFIYLLFTLTGLITAYIKVSQIKNFVFLVRTNIATVFVFLIIGAAIPWDRMITHYNLTTIENPDIKYLIELGDTNSEQLYQYKTSKMRQIETSLSERITDKYIDFTKAQQEKTWQEYTWYQFVNNTIK